MSEDHVVHVCPECFTEYDEDHEGGCPKDGARLRRITMHVEDSMIGKVLDERYVVEKKIGQGGMGSVYRAKQLSMDRVVAIKTMHEKGESSDFIGRFLREANVASKLSHPNVVSIIDFGQTDDGVLYIVMELLDGESLGERIEEGIDLTLEHVLEMTDQLLSALSSAHDAQVVHRDLKPDNIFLLDVPGGDVFAKILDFGIAKAMESGDAMTQTGQVFGTPAYMSPEQCRGDTALDARSDLYSLGCIIYELLSGSTPFQDDSLIKMMFRHVGEPVPVLVPRSPRVQEGIYDELMTFIMRLLAKAPAERFSDAMEARSALLEVRGALQESALVLPAWRQANEGEREAETMKLSFSPTLAPGDVGAHDAETLPDPPIPLAEPTRRASAGKVFMIAAGMLVGLVITAAVVFTAALSPGEPLEGTVEVVAEQEPTSVEPDDAGAPPEPAALVVAPPRTAPPEVAVAIFASGAQVRDALDEANAVAEKASKKKASKKKPRDANIFKARTSKSINAKIKAFTKRHARACVLKNFHLRPDAFWPEGKDRAKLRIVYGLDQSGEVVEASITREGSDFWDASVNRCIEEELRKVKFLKSSKLMMTTERFAAKFTFTNID